MNNRNGKGGIGTAQSLTPTYQQLIKSKAVASRYDERKQKRTISGHNAKLNKQSHVADGSADIEYRFVLIDYSDGNKQLKAKVMSRLEAYRRNKILTGTGFAWAMCSR